MEDCRCLKFGRNILLGAWIWRREGRRRWSCLGICKEKRRHLKVGRLRMLRVILLDEGNVKEERKELVVVTRKSDSVEDLKIWLGDMQKRVILNSSRVA